MRPTLLLFVVGLLSWAADPAEVSRLIASGSKLTAEQAAELEQKLVRKPDDKNTRLSLLAYYASPAADPTSARTSRRQHVLWTIANDPKELLGLRGYSSGLLQINCRGEQLADPDGARQAAQLWLDQAGHSSSFAADNRRAAADILMYCEPQKAEAILTELNDRRSLGRLYASAVLGVTGQAVMHNRTEPAGTDPALRENEFAQKALSTLQSTSDLELLEGATHSLIRSGALLWADNKLDWDYTPLGKQMMERLTRAGKSNIQLMALPMELPQRGERLPMMIRVGGSVMSQKLVRQPKPAYPLAAKQSGVQGIVRLTALIGTDGKIRALEVTSGPVELVDAAVEAVRQWEYQPTLLNGKPCQVVTVIDVNFTLSPF